MDLGTYEAFIFDNDGVIVNSEPLSCGALRELFLREFNIDIGHDFTPVIGTSDTHAITYYSEKHGIDIDKSDIVPLIDLKQQIYFDSAREELSAFEDLREFLRAIRSDYSLAVASSGSLEKIRFSLNQVGLSSFFNHIYSANSVKHGKPAPDLFLHVAEQLRISPAKCIVIEDSVKGIQGAKSAGMIAIGFTSSFPAETLLSAGADFCVNSYKELEARLSP